jgi:hypothetical protein
MKWYEVADDCGDGTSVQRRFRTREEAQAWRDKMENDKNFQQDGDGSPVTEVDTDSKWFFYNDD